MNGSDDRRHGRRPLERRVELDVLQGRHRDAAALRRGAQLLGDPAGAAAGIPFVAEEVRVAGVDRRVVRRHDHPARRVELPR
jgi:hypothetical protein